MSTDRVPQNQDRFLESNVHIKCRECGFATRIALFHLMTLVEDKRLYSARCPRCFALFIVEQMRTDEFQVIGFD